MCFCTAGFQVYTLHALLAMKGLIKYRCFHTIDCKFPVPFYTIDCQFPVPDCLSVSFIHTDCDVTDAGRGYGFALFRSLFQPRNIECVVLL